MKIIPPDAGQEYILEFENADEYQHFFDQAHERGYFLLHITSMPAQSTFRARCLGSPRSRKITPQQLKEEERGVYRIQVPHARTQSPDSGPVACQPQVPLAVEPREPRPPTDNVFDRVKALSMNEKVTLALRADFAERRVLMQENNLKINEFLLKNPRLTEQEIVWFARNPSVPMQTLLIIAHHSIWMKLLVVRSGILMNPRTPAPIVLEMIPAAGESDLIKLHNASELRMDVKAAVVREVKKRKINPRRAMD
jgi:hypothetical protein